MTIIFISIMFVVYFSKALLVFMVHYTNLS